MTDDGPSAPLKSTLRSDLTEAMRERDEVRVATLRMALTSITNEEVAGTVQRELSDEQVTAVLTREAKRRREAATAYDQANRPELAERERAELVVLEGYLPAQLSEEELHDLVHAVIEQTGASGMGSMGKVMAALTPQIAGRADGRRAAEQVRAALQQV